MTITISTIQQAYTRLWRAFSDAADSQSLGASAESGTGAVVANRGGIVTSTALLFLSGWPYKAVSGRRSVDIAVSVHETFSSDLSQVTHATTCVGYFQREKPGTEVVLRPVLELHYDFETPVREAHPLFHAQIGATTWPEDKLGRLGMAGQIDRSQAAVHYANTRIPTAFVGFGTILVTLAADHLRPRSFRLMVKTIRDIENVNPACAFLIDSLRPSGVPHAHHWYDERYVVYEWKDARTKVFIAEVPVLGESYQDKDPKKLRSQVLSNLGVRHADVVFVEGKP